MYSIGSGAIAKALAVFLKLEEKEVVLARGVDNLEGHDNLVSVRDSSNQVVEQRTTTAAFSDLGQLISTYDGIGK